MAAFARCLLPGYGKLSTPEGPIAALLCYSIKELEIAAQRDFVLPRLSIRSGNLAHGFPKAREVSSRVVAESVVRRGDATGDRGEPAFTSTQSGETSSDPITVKCGAICAVASNLKSASCFSLKLIKISLKSFPEIVRQNLQRSHIRSTLCQFNYSVISKGFKYGYR